MKRQHEPEWQDGDLVCIALVPRGQAVDWSPGSFEPELAAWVPEGTFIKIADVAKQLDVPILPQLELYAQSRISSHDCRLILARWGSVERAMENTPSEPWARAIRGVLGQCSQAGDQTEVLVEGP